MSAILYGKKVIGICTCGHPQWMHDNSIQLHKDTPVDPNRPDIRGGIMVRAEGHGECNAMNTFEADGEEDKEHPNDAFFDLSQDVDKKPERCPCKQFTWHHNEPNPHAAVS